MKLTRVDDGWKLEAHYKGDLERHVCDAIIYSIALCILVAIIWFVFGKSD